MKVYTSGGFSEFNSEGFFHFMLQNQLKLNLGTIRSLRILERKVLSNKGNALDGNMSSRDGFSWGINIGGNPIGTGYRAYIPFLDEMGCKKFGGLYLPSSLVGQFVGYLTCQDTLRGYITPKGIREMS